MIIQYNLRVKILTLVEEIALFKSCIAISKEKSFKEFWQDNSNSLPILTTLVLEYCIMCASSLSSESSFSQANCIQTKQRHSLSAKALQMSVFMKYKMELKEKLQLSTKNN